MYGLLGGCGLYGRSEGFPRTAHFVRSWAEFARKVYQSSQVNHSPLLSTNVGGMAVLISANMVRCFKSVDPSYYDWCRLAISDSLALTEPRHAPPVTPRHPRTPPGTPGYIGLRGFHERRILFMGGWKGVRFRFPVSVGLFRFIRFFWIFRFFRFFLSFRFFRSFPPPMRAPAFLPRKGGFVYTGLGSFGAFGITSFSVVGHITDRCTISRSDHAIQYYRQMHQ